MKKLAILISLGLIFNFNVRGQNEEEIIKNIRNRFAYTNEHLKGYKKIEKKVFVSSEGGVIQGFYNDSILALIHCDYKGEMGGVKEDYYFWDQKLFFVFIVTENYTAPIYEEGSVVASKTEARFYFHNNEMIRWLDNQKQSMDKNSDLFVSTKLEIIEEALRLKNLIESDK